MPQQNEEAQSWLQKVNATPRAKADTQSGIFYYAMDAILGHWPATQPPVAVSSMAGAVAELATMVATAQLPVGTVSSGNTTTIDSLGEPADLEWTQSADVPLQANSNQTTAVIPLQQRKRKKSKMKIQSRWCKRW